MSTSSLSDFFELSRHLKQERLYVNSEREHLIALHNSISLNAEKLYQSAWITRHQKSALGRLILGSDDAMPASCCQQVNNLENVAIVEGYRRLTYHETKIGRFLSSLRDMPKLIASCLVHAETAGGYNSDEIHRVACAIISGLYGNVVMPEEENNVLLLLKHLTDIQVSRSDDPSRLLRRGSCAFSTIFRLLTESMFSARIFLTAALHHPVMQLLMEDEWFYDIDAERALHRFPPSERLRRFGTPNSKEYEQNTKIYREQIVNKLVALVNHFISSIQASMYCFPPSLAWIVSQLYHSLTKEHVGGSALARAICADLVLASFICPAICDPEPHGITSDAPISYIARHNLMQVGQILQVLTVSSLDEIDPKSRDLYGKFPKGCMAFVLNTLLDAPFSASPPPSSTSVAGFCRSSMLLSCPELMELMSFVHHVMESMGEEVAARKQLEELLGSSSLPPLSVIQSLCSATHCPTGLSLSIHVSPNATPQATPPGTPKSARKPPRTAQQSKEKKRSLLSAPGGAEGHGENGSEVEGAANTSVTNAAEELIVISLGIVSECPGMLSELKVLEQEAIIQGRQKKVKYNSLLPGEDDPVSESDILANEKRTRFSLSHDQDSIATSDNLEAISEAASSHSVGSDLDNENDNLSDMVSANVSGRGTPNVSGRDTPISQADSQVEVGAEGHEPEVEEQPRPVAPSFRAMQQKTNRVDVTERFGKFEIRQELERDDIKSVVSDTWSTDVIASDSEPPEQNQLERLEEVVEEPAANLLGVHEVLESSEIASDAWSTDVLASDTSERQSERLLELDQDDLASVSGRSVGIGSEVSEIVELVGEDAPQACGKQSPRSTPFRNSAVVVSVPSSVSSLSLQQIAAQEPSEIPALPTENLLNSSSLLLAAGDTVDSGVFQMDRYIHDSGDSSTAPLDEVLVVPGVVPVDSSVLQAFDPLGYATVERKSSADSQYGNSIGVDRSARLKMVSSDICLSRMPADPIAGGDLLGASWLSGSAGSLIDLGMGGSHGMGLAAAAGGSLVSVDTLTAKDSVSSENIRPECILDEVMPPGFVTAAGSGVDLKTGAIPKSEPRESGLRARPALVGLNGSTTDAALKQKDYDVDGDEKNASLPHRASGKPDFSSTANVPLTILDLNKEDDDRKIVDKRKTGLFHVFRERLSKGAFPVSGQNVKGGKRKTTASKGYDRDDVFRVSGEPADKVDSLSGVRVILTQGSSDAGEEVIPKSLHGSNGGKAEETAVDTTDDILAKYRKPVGLVKPGNNGAGSHESDILSDSGKEKERLEDDDGVPVYDSNNLENCKAFLDAKKKLRLILSHIDLQFSSTNHPALFIGRVQNSSSDTSDIAAPDTKDNDLVLQLKAQLAEAINLQDCDLIAQLHETIRCLRQFDNYEIKKLLRTMRDEYRVRSSYIAYLARCRQGLLSSLAFVDRLVIRVTRDKTMVNKHLLTVLVRLFLEKHESMILKFVAEFAKLTVSDEKADLVQNFLSRLHRQMEIDEMWQAASVSQLNEAEMYIERSVMSRIYTQAMFPNGEADVMRDQILHEHMQKLAKVITPFHKDLRIPKIYHYECPWPAAQTHIYMINVYKTPRDKLQCVLRCSSTIMNLLSMASDRSVPAADDFMPVLIFVLIKSGTMQLLSNVQFVRQFYESRLTGEEQYWWMQFVSAIEFVKTMDYAE